VLRRIARRSLPTPVREVVRAEQPSQQRVA
jgi:hypothetical protein